MNMIEKQLAVKQHCIERLETVKPYPDYPAERYIGDITKLELLTIPEGPWDTEPRQTMYVDASVHVNGSLRIDALGRPLHPWIEEMAASIGVVAGTGFYRHPAGNRTADPIVITNEKNPHILLIQRMDNAAWAFPGGFLDHDAESTVAAGARECREETAVELSGEPAITIYTGPVADERSTAHAWAYTDAKLWRPTHQQPIVIQPEEVMDAGWFPIDNMPKPMHGSHAKILEFALREIA